MASTNNIQNGTSSPSSSCSEYSYDVFLSFGGDTRNSFTDHLYHALVFGEEIKTFRDNEELETGKPISSELLKAIEKSRIAVVILSEKYASSTWCLEELSKILECMDAGRMGVRPIFYKVDPSDVRHLKGAFADAFAKHVLAIFKENVEKKVQRWRDALRRVAGLSGHHLKDEPESPFIRKFVGRISSELNGTINGRDVKDFRCTMLKAVVNSCIDNLCVFRNTLKEPTDYRRLPIYHDEVCGVGGSYAKDPRPQWSPSSPEETNAGTSQYSYEDPHLDNQISKTSYKTAHDLDFHPLLCNLCYNSCFPPSKVTQELFSQQSRGHSVTIDIPPNLCDDNNWMGLALFALFSMHGDKEAFQYNLMSEIPQFLYCQLGTSVAGLDNAILACHTSGAEMEWLNNQGEFIWICYIQRQPLEHMLRQCSHIEASFVSDWPGVTVQACVLRLVYLHDLLQFQQNMKQCNLILEKSDFTSQILADQEKTNGQNLDDEAGPPTTSSSNGDYFKRRPIYQGKTNEDFDRCLIYNSCFPQIELVDWFSHQSDEPRVTILLPPNLYDDTTWTGLALFAFFSVLDHSTTLIGNLDSQVRCRLGFLSQNSNFCLESLHSYCLTEEDFSLLKLGGFMWLSYIPRGQFPKWLSRCSSIEAEISDCQGLTVHKCGLHLLYQNDQEEFKETIRLFKASFSNNLENEVEASTSNSANDQDSHPDEDFDRCLIYNSCFPQSEVVNWFSHPSNGPRVTIILPPNLYDDTTWTGLALFAFFSVLDHSTTLVGSQGSQVHCRLGFLSQNRIFCLESLHSYCLTEEDISLLKLGGFMWLSYIPRGWFPKWLNRCSSIDAEINDCSIEAEINDCPGLTVQKCGLHLLYQIDEEEFKETIRLCKASFSNNHENDEDSHPERLASNEDLHNETSRRPINQGESDEANYQLCKTSQRPISKLLPSTSENVEEEEDCTSLLTFPSQEIVAGTSRKRSRLWLEVSNDSKGTYSITGKGHRGSTISISLPKPWFKRFLQVTGSVEGILLNASRYIEVRLNADAFLLIKSLSGFRSLVSLNLTDCNLEDGVLPNDFSCLSSLAYLDLSNNHFTCLPESFNQLSKLQFLNLDSCRRLESLTNIPLSTRNLTTRDCTSVKHFSRFEFIDYLSLVDDGEYKNQIQQMDGFISVFPQYTPLLLPSSIENAEEEEDCTETIPFRNEQSGTATGTKRMLKTWFKGFARIKDMALKFSGAYRQRKPCTGSSSYKKGHQQNQTPGGASVSAQSCDVVREDEEEAKEWMAQVEPGVLITFESLPNGGNDLKRIRFSREMFNKWQAQRWWGENYDRIMEVYNVQRFNRQALHTPPRSEDEQRDSSYSKLGSARESPVGSSLNKEWTPRNYHRPSESKGYYPSDPVDQGGSHHYNAGSSTFRMGGPKGEASSMGASQTTTSSRDEASVSISNASDLETEWVEQDEPGVYITIRELADGIRELRRVRFSREKFGEVNAKLWWEENRERIQAQYL